MRNPNSFDRVARKRMRNQRPLLDSGEWDALQDAMFFCLSAEQERLPTKEHELRWIEFRQYVIDSGGELTHESRLVAVTETRTTAPTKQKRKMRTLFVGTGGSIEETVWDLLEQVSKEIRVRQEELAKLPPVKQSLITNVRADGFVTFPVPKGAIICLSHGRGCVCPKCQMQYGRVPN